MLCEEGVLPLPAVEVQPDFYTLIVGCILCIYMSEFIFWPQNRAGTDYNRQITGTNLTTLRDMYATGIRKNMDADPFNLGPELFNSSLLAGASD